MSSKIKDQIFQSFSNSIAKKLQYKDPRNTSVRNLTDALNFMVEYSEMIREEPHQSTDKV